LTGSYIVTDSPPLSTADLYRRLLSLYGHGDRVIRFPVKPVTIIARAVLGARADSLLGNAAFDGQRFADHATWSPKWSMDQALARTVAETRR
jgi:hypothetical protein